MSLLNLEDVFKKACKQHPQLQILKSQWRFDKELISKALQNVGTTFPHYSRHDASHSKQLVVNIERMLGHKIKHLTATDIWLILEAAYQHDIGMVITYEQIAELESDAFKVYVDDIIRDKGHELNDFATQWKNCKNDFPIGKGAYDTFSLFIQLISGWYRGKHPKLSEEIVLDPSKINLNSPRNELVPSRLFKILASICSAHGKDFDEVMKLPLCEAGMATEDCHPRFVACLIRMADLLDIDDNRFCPVMMSMLSKELPKTSQAHFDKHHSIKHFRIDTDYIEIEVVCPTIDAYEVASEWFSWLEKEYNRQSQHWNQIVPFKKMGVLPTLITPKVMLENYIILDEGKKPTIDIDKTALLELLRGTGLYNSKFDCLREVLQNAIDATLIHIWENHKTEIALLNSPLAPELSALYNSYPIQIELLRDETNPKFCTVRISDKGIGIDKEDLKYMLKVGSSKKNKRKARMIDEMPIWYRPSGCFGIGLQSIFLLADKFKIYTKSYYSTQELEIELSNENNVAVSIKEINYSQRAIGTTVEFYMKLEEIPASIEHVHIRNNSFSALFEDYDFTNPKSSLVDYEYLCLLTKCIQIAYSNSITINIFTDYIEGYEDTQRDVERSYYDPETNIVLSNIEFKHVLSLHSITPFFKGQRIAKSDLSIANEYVNCDADFYGYKADEFLSYNRDEILNDKRENAADNAIKALCNYIDKHFDKIPSEQKCYAAAFYIIAKNGQDGLKKYEDELLVCYKLSINKKEVLLRELLDEIKKKDCYKLAIVSSNREDECIGEGLNILVSTRYNSNWKLILYFLQDVRYCQISGPSLNQMSKNIYCICRDDIPPFSNNIIGEVLLQQYIYWDSIGNRLLFPVWNKYKKLGIKATIHYPRIIKFDSYTFNKFLVLPGLFKRTNQGKRPYLEADDNLISWVDAHKVNQEVSREEIKALYVDLIKYLNSVLDETENDAKKDNNA